MPPSKPRRLGFGWALFQDPWNYPRCLLQVWEILLLRVALNNTSSKPFFFFPCFSCLFVFLFSNKIIFKELHILSLCSEQPCKWSFLWMLNKYVCTHLPWLWVQHCRHKPTSYCHEGLSSLLDNQFGIQSNKTGMLVGNFKLWVVIFSPSWSGSLSNSWLDWVQKAQHFRGSNQ